MSDNFFSIDFGEKDIKIVDLKKTGDKYEIKYIGKINLVDNFYNSDLEKTVEEQAEEIRKMIEILGIEKKNVVVSINNNLAYHQIIEMPLLKEKELISAIRYQADQFIPMPIDEVNIDLEIIKENQQDKKILILVAAASKKIIQKIQETIEFSGFTVNSIETNLSSFSRLINFFSKEICDYYKINDLFLVDFQNSFSTFSYFEEKDLIIKKNHSVAFGYDLFLKDIIVNLDLSKEKIFDFLKTYKIDQDSSYPIEKIVLPIVREFALEIQRFISFKKPSIIFFSGEIINFPELISLVKKVIPDFRVEIFNPAIFFKKNSLLETVFQEIPFYVSVIGAFL